MIRLPRLLYGVLSSRALTPVVMGVFLLLYIGIAFFTEEALITLIGLAGSNIFLIALFALIPLNRGLRLLAELKGYSERRRALLGKADSASKELFDETVDVPGVPSFTEVERRLAASGYKTRAGGNSLAAWRGISVFPARALFLIATVCLFSGILMSLDGRTSYRGAVMEGEPLPLQSGQATDVVERITLKPAAGPILAKVLTMETKSLPPDRGITTFGLYPPARYRGAFVYPRYMGIGLYYRFVAPDLPRGYEAHTLLAIYPPGKEDRKEIPESPYRLVFSMAQPADGSDPYMTGRVTINFKLLKGNDLLMNGSAPMGGEFNGNGYRLAFPDVRRLVITDFILDHGVVPIWAAAILFCVAASVWLPIRCLSPRREMVFVRRKGALHACSRAEGGRRKHAGVFHDALDILETERHEGA
jgi:hypothetical protein